MKAKTWQKQRRRRRSSGRRKRNEKKKEKRLRRKWRVDGKKRERRRVCGGKVKEQRGWIPRHQKTLETRDDNSGKGANDQECKEVMMRRRSRGGWRRSMSRWWGGVWVAEETWIREWRMVEGLPWMFKCMWGEEEDTLLPLSVVWYGCVIINRRKKKTREILELKVGDVFYNGQKENMVMEVEKKKGKKCRKCDDKGWLRCCQTKIRGYVMWVRTERRKKRNIKKKIK